MKKSDRICSRSNVINMVKVSMKEIRSLNYGIRVISKSNIEEPLRSELLADLKTRLATEADFLEALQADLSGHRHY